MLFMALGRGQRVPLRAEKIKRDFSRGVGGQRAQPVPDARTCRLLTAATAPPARERAAAAATPVRLFIGGVAAGVTAAELAERFAPFGQVADVQLVAGKAPGACGAAILRPAAPEHAPRQAAASTRRAAPPTWTCCCAPRSATRTCSAASAWCVPCEAVVPRPSLTPLLPPTVQRLHVARLQAARGARRGALRLAPAPRGAGGRCCRGCARVRCVGCGARGSRRSDARGAGGGAAGALAAAARVHAAHPVALPQQGATLCLACAQPAPHTPSFLSRSSSKCTRAAGATPAATRRASSACLARTAHRRRGPPRCRRLSCALRSPPRLLPPPPSARCPPRPQPQRRPRKQAARWRRRRALSRRHLRRTTRGRACSAAPIPTPSPGSSTSDP